MLRPISAAPVQRPSPPARVRRRRDRAKAAAAAGSLGETTAESVERRVSPLSTGAIDGRDGRAAARTVAAEILAVLMTFRQGG